MAEGWGDLESVLVNLRHNTVLQLQHIIKGLSENGIASLTKTGRKQELIDRIVTVIQDIQRDGRLDKWQKARNILTNRTRPETKPLGDPIHPTYTYNAYPSVSTPTGPTWSTALRPYVPSLTHAPNYQPPKWKYSPFYHIEEAVSPVQECLESTNSQDRKTAKLNFTLKNEHLAKLANRSPRYQLRLYCTSSQYYIQTGTSFRAAVCPIEFPPTCEVRINSQSLVTNFRGIKKKPGTAPPADITALTKRGTAGLFNQLEMVYVNSAQAVAGKRPPPPQKYYLVVNLVRITSVGELVRALENRVEPKETAIDKIRRDTEQNALEGIELSFTKLTLRDPLTYARLKHPCRSTGCTHWQCFDAESWYAMNEQTTTWLCPVCDKTLNVEELVLDGYVLDILQSVPEEVDDVLVEPDGEWHTADAMYGSPTWMEQHPQAPNSKPLPALTRQMELTGKGNSQVWNLEDSDSDGEGFVKREVLDSKMAFSSSPPPTTAGTAPPNAAPRMNNRDSGNVIDLTLDSDDEDQPPAPPPPQPSLSQSQSQSQRGRHITTARRDDRVLVPRHRRVEVTPLPILQPPPSGVPPLRVSTGPPSSMPPPQPPTSSMLGKRRNRDSDDDPRYRSPDEREQDYDREERDYRYSHKAPRRENEEHSPPRPVYSPSRVLPAMTSERRTNGATSNGYHNHNQNSSSSSSAFSNAHARAAPSLPPIQPWSSSTYGYVGSFARSPESQSPTLPSPPAPPYYNNSPPAPASNENYRVAAPLRTNGSGGYNRRWDQRLSWD